MLAELNGDIIKLHRTRCDKKMNKSNGMTMFQRGGILVSSGVNFWRSLPEKDFRLSFEHSRKSYLFPVVGSSLVVTPTEDMPLEALRSGAKLIIINKGATPPFFLIIVHT